MPNPSTPHLHTLSALSSGPVRRCRHTSGRLHRAPREHDPRPFGGRVPTNDARCESQRHTGASVRKRGRFHFYALQVSARRHRRMTDPTVAAQHAASLSCAARRLRGAPSLCPRSPVRCLLAGRWVAVAAVASVAAAHHGVRVAVAAAGCGLVAPFSSPHAKPRPSPLGPLGLGPPAPRVSRACNAA